MLHQRLFQFLTHLKYGRDITYCYTGFESLTGYHSTKQIKVLEKFGLIYTQSTTYVLIAILKTESRLMFRNLQNQESTMTELFVYKSQFKTVFNQFFENDLARLEFSGILQKIRLLYHSLDLKNKVSSIARLHKSHVNPEIEKFGSSFLRTSWGADKYKHVHEKTESTNFSDLLVVWVLLVYLLGISFVILLYEILF